MTKNINPLYLQEVSREYYDKILNKSQPHKDAAKLTRKWAKKNPNIPRNYRVGKFFDFAETMHKNNDELKNKFYGTTKSKDHLKPRNDYITRSLVLKNFQLDPKSKKKYRDDIFKTFRVERTNDRAERINNRKAQELKDAMFIKALDNMLNK